MWVDPIVEEIRQFREAYAAQFNYDLDAICHDLMRQKQESGHELVSLTVKRPQEEALDISLQPTQNAGLGR